MFKELFNGDCIMGKSNDCRKPVRLTGFKRKEKLFGKWQTSHQYICEDGHKSEYQHKRAKRCSMPLDLIDVFSGFGKTWNKVNK